MDRTDSLIRDNADLGLTPRLLGALEGAGIDVPLSLANIRRANRGEYDNPPLLARTLPQPDGKRIIDTRTFTLTLPLDEARARLAAIPLPVSLTPEAYGSVSGELVTFSPAALQELGFLLAPAVAFGSLNGGSASSYLDRTRIRNAYAPLLDIYADLLPECDRVCQGRPKGCTPAFFHPDGTAGFDFMALKVRALLIRSLKWRKKTGIPDPPPLYPVFEMTSHLTHDALRRTYEGYGESALLGELVRECGWTPDDIRSAQQPLLAAMTHDRPFRIFDRAGGLEGVPLAMPGGHGHSFYVLREIYRDLYASGVRFAYLGNIDNSGFLVDDRAVAILALTGKQGIFDFSRRTEADVKGGILIEDMAGRLNCGDLGLAITEEEVAVAQAAGAPVLFNTAGGLFNLEWLIANLDRVIRELPTRLIRQEKDRGRYTHTEQVTWEILGMMDNKLVSAVDKYERFIAAKMVVEMLLASPLGEARLGCLPATLAPVAAKLQAGLARLLAGPYGLVPENGRYRPRTVPELLSGC